MRTLKVKGQMELGGAGRTWENCKLVIELPPGEAKRPWTAGSTYGGQANAWVEDGRVVVLIRRKKEVTDGDVANDGGVRVRGS